MKPAGPLSLRPACTWMTFRRCTLPARTGCQHGDGLPVGERRALGSGKSDPNKIGKENCRRPIAECDLVRSVHARAGASKAAGAVVRRLDGDARAGVPVGKGG